MKAVIITILISAVLAIIYACMIVSADFEEIEKQIDEEERLNR